MPESLKEKEVEYISLNAEYASWEKYVFSDMRNALKGMEAEIAAMKHPGEKHIFRWLWARLQDENEDHQKTLDLFTKYASPFPDSSEYLPTQLDILIALGKYETALRIARSYLMSGRMEVLPRLAKLYGLTAQPREAARLLIHENRQETVLENFFLNAQGERALFEDFLAALDWKSLDEWEKLLLAKFLNIRGQFVLADLIASSATAAPPHPPFVEKNAARLELRANYTENQPLIITFPPIEHPPLRQHYENKGIENLELLSGSRKSAYPRFFASFANVNLLHILDDYQSWCLLNLDSLLFYVKKMIHELKPSKVVTFGSSSGGFDSLLYGKLLNADLAIALAPQAVAFHIYMCRPFHVDMCRKYSLLYSPFAYLNRMLARSPKTAKTAFSTYYSSQCPQDVFHAGLLRSLPNMRLNALNLGHTHILVNSATHAMMRGRVKDDLRGFCGIEA